MLSIFYIILHNKIFNNIYFCFLVLYGIDEKQLEIIIPEAYFNSFNFIVSPAVCFIRNRYKIIFIR